jgi:hypothetical protein
MIFSSSFAPFEPKVGEIFFFHQVAGLFDRLGHGGLSPCFSQIALARQFGFQFVNDVKLETVVEPFKEAHVDLLFLWADDQFMLGRSLQVCMAKLVSATALSRRTANFKKAILKPIGTHPEKPWLFRLRKRSK